MPRGGPARRPRGSGAASRAASAVSSRHTLFSQSAGDGEHESGSKRTLTTMWKVAPDSQLSASAAHAPLRIPDAAPLGAEDSERSRPSRSDAASAASRGSVLSPMGMDDMRQSLDREVSHARHAHSSDGSTDDEADDGARAFISQTQPMRPGMQKFGLGLTSAAAARPVTASQTVLDTQDAVRFSTQEPRGRHGSVPPGAPDTRAAHRTQSRLEGAEDASRRAGGFPSHKQRTLDNLVKVPAVNMNPFIPARTLPRKASAAAAKSEALEKLLKSSRDGRPAYLLMFQEVGVIGAGAYSDVYRARCRMDGVTYAVKRRRSAVRMRTDGSVSNAQLDEVREVHALAALAGCSHILRYYFAWREDDHLYVQTELAWGSLSDAVRGHRPNVAPPNRASVPPSHGRGRPAGIMAPPEVLRSRPASALDEERPSSRGVRTLMLSSQESVGADGLGAQAFSQGMRAPPNTRRAVSGQTNFSGMFPPSQPSQVPHSTGESNGSQAVVDALPHAGVKRRHRQQTIDEMMLRKASAPCGPIIATATFVAPDADGGDATRTRSSRSGSEMHEDEVLQSPRRRTRYDESIAAPPPECAPRPAAHEVMRTSSLFSDHGGITPHQPSTGLEFSATSASQTGGGGTAFTVPTSSASRAASVTASAYSAGAVSRLNSMDGPMRAPLLHVDGEDTQDVAASILPPRCDAMSPVLDRGMAMSPVVGDDSEALPFRQPPPAAAVMTRQVSFGAVHSLEPETFAHADDTTSQMSFSAQSRHTSAADAAPVNGDYVAAAAAGVFPMAELDCLRVLRDVCHALMFMHARGLAHLDIKPANILVVYEGGPALCDVDGSWVPEAALLTGVASTDDAAREYVQAQVAAGVQLTLETATQGRFTGSVGALPVALDRLLLAGAVRYKLGDFGQVARLDAHHVDEGDCRYVSHELLNGVTTNLPAADMFSLGITAVELLTGMEPPSGDADYQRLRAGELPPMPHLSRPLQELLARMLHPDPAARPRAADVLEDAVMLRLERVTGRSNASSPQSAVPQPPTSAAASAPTAHTASFATQSALLPSSVAAGSRLASSAASLLQALQHATPAKLPGNNGASGGDVSMGVDHTPLLPLLDSVAAATPHAVHVQSTVSPAFDDPTPIATRDKLASAEEEPLLCTANKPSPHDLMRDLDTSFGRGASRVSATSNPHAMGPSPLHMVPTLAGDGVRLLDSGEVVLSAAVARQLQEVLKLAASSGEHMYPHAVSSLLL